MCSILPWCPGENLQTVQDDREVGLQDTNGRSPFCETSLVHQDHQTHQERLIQDRISNVTFLSAPGVYVGKLESQSVGGVI